MTFTERREVQISSWLADDSYIRAALLSVPERIFTENCMFSDWLMWDVLGIPGKLFSDWLMQDVLGISGKRDWWHLLIRFPEVPGRMFLERLNSVSELRTHVRLKRSALSVQVKPSKTPQSPETFSRHSRRYRKCF